MPPGCLLAEPVTLVTKFSMPLGARLLHYAAELRTLSVTYPLCGLALAFTMDNLSEITDLQVFTCF